MPILLSHQRGIGEGTSLGMKQEVVMPILSRFAGITICMMFRDTKHHNKPHVHARYGDDEASIAIDGELLAGYLPPKQMKIVVGWLALHEDEAYAAWNLAVQGQQFDRIEAM